MKYFITSGPGSDGSCSKMFYHNRHGYGSGDSGTLQKNKLFKLRRKILDRKNCVLTIRDRQRSKIYFFLFSIFFP